MKSTLVLIIPSTAKISKKTTAFFFSFLFFLLFPGRGAFTAGLVLLEEDVLAEDDGRFALLGAVVGCLEAAFALPHFPMAPATQTLEY